MLFVPAVILTLLLTVAYTSPLFEPPIPILNPLPPNAYPASPFSWTGSDSSRDSVNLQSPGDQATAPLSLPFSPQPLAYLPDIGFTILDNQATNPVSPPPQHPRYLPNLGSTFFAKHPTEDTTLLSYIYTTHAAYQSTECFRCSNTENGDITFACCDESQFCNDYTPHVAVTANSVENCKSPVCARITYTEGSNRLQDRELTLVGPPKEIAPGSDEYTTNCTPTPSPQAQPE